MDHRSPEFKLPKTRCDFDLTDIMVLRLASEGYDTITNLNDMPTDELFDAWEFLLFQDAYQSTVAELNKPDGH